MKVYLKNSIIFRTSSFFFILTLRQGTILIAIHQIALGSCLLAILMVGMAHAGEVMELLKADMADDAQREGLISMEDYRLGNYAIGIHGEVTSSNHQKFVLAERLAKATIIVLYGSILLTGLYILFCVTLLLGAIKSKKEYIDPWIFLAIATAGVIIIIMYVGDNTPLVVDTFNGHTIYRISCALFLLGHYYCIIAVASYSAELKHTNGVRYKKNLTESTLRLFNDSGEKCDADIIKEDKKGPKEKPVRTAVIILHNV